MFKYLKHCTQFDCDRIKCEVKFVLVSSLYLTLTLCKQRGTEVIHQMIDIGIVPSMKPFHKEIFITNIENTSILLQQIPISLNYKNARNTSVRYTRLPYCNH